MIILVGPKTLEPSRSTSRPSDVQSSDIARCFWAAASLRWQELAFLEGEEDPEKGVVSRGLHRSGFSR